MINQLTNHLWQSTLFAAAAGLLTLAFQKNHAQVRYWLWLSASLKFLVPFALLLSFGSHLVRTPAAAHRIPTTITPPAVSLQISEPFLNDAPLVRVTHRTTDWFGLAIFCLWTGGFGVIAWLRLQGWLRIRSALRSSSPLEIPGEIEVRSSPGLLEPGVVGLLRPVLFLPAGIAERLTPQQLEAVLAHELCHVRRRDNLFAAIHMVVEAIFWFHPLVWWIGARLVGERERACDEDVLRMGNEPHVYAEGILNVCKLYVESPLVCVSGVTGADLKRRIHDILNAGTMLNLSLAKKATLAIAAAAALALPVIVGVMNAPFIRAQSAARPQFEVVLGQFNAFEVATIKPADPNDRGGRFITMQGGRRFVVKNYTLKGLVGAAYNLTPQAISGGPAWIESDRYDVLAATPGETKPNLDQQMAMLRKLLADRFQLTFHRQEKELSIYALTLAKNGPKLKESTASPDDPPVLVNRVFPQRVLLPARNATMVQFASMMQRAVLDRPVVDRTGLSGKYDFDLEWMPDETQFEGKLAIDPAGVEPAKPDLFAAIQQQLGLRLQGTKGPVATLVIDQVERPSAN